jgi:uncharacterized protein (DUF1330 family)
MTAYVIIVRESPIRDQAAYGEYLRLVRESGAAATVKPLVLFGAVHGLEGKAPDGFVVLEFPNVEAAKAWYQSPGYQAAVPHRIASGDWRAVIVEGV